MAEAALNGPVAGLRTTLAIMGGDAWAKLDEQEKASRLQPFAPIAPLVGPHCRGLLDLPVTEADIRRLRTPTLLVYGRASFPFERAIADRLAQLRPDLELHTIEDAGHNAHRDRADAFNSIALPFLTSGQKD